MRVFVTGAAGFVGTRLCARLAARGDELCAHDGELDVSDAARVREAIDAARPEAIVHLAAISSVPDAEADPLRAFRVNALGARAVLDSALHAAPRARVLLVTSAAIYGAAPRGSAGFDESAPLRPATAYARTKAAADALGAAYAQRGLAVVRARPFNHTGAGRPAAYVEARLARDVAAIAAGRSAPRLTLANPESQRDFLDVEDVVDAYLALLDPRVPAGAYNIARGEPVSMLELAQRLCRLAAIAPEIVATSDPQRAPDATIGSAAKLRAATGWRPQRALDETLRELLAAQSKGDRSGAAGA
ncbi:MAG TPA: NAD-dependent epimerase/dehydratase family protein [Myxococcota bacterium]|nr:NAD-dependent epimerase/dehydratase family protein [Myxococcota bacterium]